MTLINDYLPRTATGDETPSLPSLGMGAERPEVDLTPRSAVQVMADQMIRAAEDRIHMYEEMMRPVGISDRLTNALLAPTMGGDFYFSNGKSNFLRLKAGYEEVLKHAREMRPEQAFTRLIELESDPKLPEMMEEYEFAEAFLRYGVNVSLVLAAGFTSGLAVGALGLTEGSALTVGALTSRQVLANLAVRSTTFVATHRALGEIVTGEPMLYDRKAPLAENAFNLAEEIMLTAGMFKFLGMAQGGYNGFARQALLRLAAGRLAQQGLAASEAALAKEAAMIAQSPAFQGLWHAGSFTSELGAFTGWEMTAQTYQMAKAWELDLAKLAEGTLSPEAWQERILFLFALKAGGALARPLTSAAHTEVERMAFAKAEVRLRDLDQRIEGLREQLTSFKNSPEVSPPKLLELGRQFEAALQGRLDLMRRYAQYVGQEGLRYFEETLRDFQAMLEGMAEAMQNFPNRMCPVGAVAEAHWAKPMLMSSLGGDGKSGKGDPVPSITVVDLQLQKKSLAQAGAKKILAVMKNPQIWEDESRRAAALYDVLLDLESGAEAALKVLDDNPDLARQALGASPPSYPRDELVVIWGWKILVEIRRGDGEFQLRAMKALQGRKFGRAANEAGYVFADAALKELLHRWDYSAYQGISEKFLELLRELIKDPSEKVSREAVNALGTLLRQPQMDRVNRNLILTLLGDARRDPLLGHEVWLQWSQYFPLLGADHEAFMDTLAALGDLAQFPGGREVAISDLGELSQWVQRDEKKIFEIFRVLQRLDLKSYFKKADVRAERLNGSIIFALVNLSEHWPLQSPRDAPENLQIRRSVKEIHRALRAILDEPLPLSPEAVQDFIQIRVNQPAERGELMDLILYALHRGAVKKAKEVDDYTEIGDPERDQHHRKMLLESQKSFEIVIKALSESPRPEHRGWAAEESDDTGLLLSLSGDPQAEIRVKAVKKLGKKLLSASFLGSGNPALRESRFEEIFRTLERLESDPEASIRELARTLRKGALEIIHSPDATSRKEVYYKASEKLDSLASIHEPRTPGLARRWWNRLFK